MRKTNTKTSKESKIIAHRYRLFFYVFALFFIIPIGSHAYIDPGSGSYLFQVIIASALGGLFAIKMFWKNIKTRVGRIFTGKRSKKNE